MKAGLVNAFAVLVLWTGAVYGQQSDCTVDAGSVHGYTLTAVDEVTPIPLVDYAGKVLVIFNSATYWGLNVAQNTGMNALYDKYNSTDMFEALSIPCNQFGLQEPGTNAEMLNGIQHVRPGNNFLPKFKLTQKSNVNGQEVGATELELYTFMKDACPGTQNIIGTTARLYWTPMKQHDITWNYEKFLIGKDGQPYKRYAPVINPSEMEADIEYLMSL